MAVRTNQTGGRCDDRGTALVEFAIIVPLFFALLLGMFSGGLAYNQRMQLTHAAREGARYGAALPQDQDNWATRVRDVVVNRAAGDLTATQVCVALVKTDSTNNVVTVKDKLGNRIAWNDGGTFPANCYTDDNTDTGVRVHVAVRRGAQLQWLIASSNITLNGQATSKHE